MKEALIGSTLAVNLHDTPVPTPQANQVLIKVVVSGCNPKDWKVPKEGVGDLVPKGGPPKNHGDDIAGYVEAVGAGVTAFKKGDRVAAFHEMLAPHGSYAEYAIAWDHTTFHIPEGTSFEEAATIPLAALTAGLGIYQRLGLPLPWNPATKQIPLLVYGGATAVGAFAIKLARASNIHPIITVAGRGIPFVESLIDKGKGDKVLDYRVGDAALRKQIQEAAGGQPFMHAFDTVSEKGSFENIFACLSKGATFTYVLPGSLTGDKVPDGVETPLTLVGTPHYPIPEGQFSGDPDFAEAFFGLLGRGLAKGWFTGHPYQVREGGLNGVEQALKDLEAGKASAVKYVFRIADTPGL